MRLGGIRLKLFPSGELARNGYLWLDFECRLKSNSKKITGKDLKSRTTLNSKKLS